MATGLSEGERQGDNVVTMPRADSDSSLGKGRTGSQGYSESWSLKTIISQPKAEFRVFRGGSWENLSNVNNDLFMLSDNFAALSKLYQDGVRPTLIYLDPPYGTGMDFHGRDLTHAYNDSMPVLDYVEFMRRRLILMREILAEDGSIYLHIGHQMVGHLKVVMDEIFGPSNFRNLITRKKCSSKNSTKNKFPNLHDYVLFYTKSNSYKWLQPSTQPTAEWIDKEYPKVDSKGRYKLVPVHAPGTRNGATGGEWRGMMPPPGKHWQLTPEKLEALDKQGDIHWSRNGNPRRKVYLLKDKTIPLTDYWVGYRDAHHQSIKITGYPTEKNLQMLEMLVRASSEAGDLVLDPFSGSGTTLHAATGLNRNWIGIDESVASAQTVLQRFSQGLTPMGDYVNKPKQQSELFDGVHTLSRFELAVEARAMEQHRSEIDQLTQNYVNKFMTEATP